MAHKGTYTSPRSWNKHMRPGGKREFWKGERAEARRQRQRVRIEFEDEMERERQKWRLIHSMRGW